MREPSSPIPFPPAAQPIFDGMDAQSVAIEEDPSSSLWDWGDLLDFAVNDSLPLTLDDSDHHPLVHPPPLPTPPPPPPPEHEISTGQAAERVRKRDPRLTCSNFLQGRIPCSCPEIDEKLEEEGLPGKKRARTGARTGSGTARCQVPGCEADITELKGYHKRHRVCLRCANASSVLLGGESKRYCQQCGKFHLLSDFDEGKRSCRRKLERHNNRRRRKPTDCRSSADEEFQAATWDEELNEGDNGKENPCISIQDQELLEFDDPHTSTLGSTPITQSIITESIRSFAASHETQRDEGNDDKKCGMSPSYFDNKSAYSSACPTGRVSFKLYDWNPADFPRRLRHQIFQWLASMPVELEAYIRPGCTILTVFIAMPNNMWEKLLLDPVTYLHDFIAKPGKMLYGKGCVTVHLNDTIFRVITGENSVVKAESKLRAPRLHYVHPTCFEAGKPVELIACGSNLLQPKFRFLVSFTGKYLSYDYSITSSFGKDGKESPCYDHQLCKVYIRHLKPNLYGPAFIEVENESGLSNFIPILVGDEDVCSEMRALQRKYDASTLSGEPVASNSLPNSCRDTETRQAAFSQIMLDIAWLLKAPDFEVVQQSMICCQIQRFNSLLSFLIKNESTLILERAIKSIEVWLDIVGLNNPTNSPSGGDISLLRRQMNLARSLSKKHHVCESQMQRLESALSSLNCSSESCSETTSQEPDAGINSNARATTCETDPLLYKEVVMNVNVMNPWRRSMCSRTVSNTVLGSRPTIIFIATVVVCFAVCAVLLHPNKVTKFAVSIRSRLFDKS